MVSQWKLINENYKNLDGYKRVAWPPVSEERIVKEFTPQPQPQQSLHPEQQHQPTQQYRASSYDNNYRQYQPQQQTKYQQQPIHPPYQNQYQQHQLNQSPSYQAPLPQQQQQQQQQQPSWAYSQQHPQPYHQQYQPQQKYRPSPSTTNYKSQQTQVNQFNSYSQPQLQQQQQQYHHQQQYQKQQQLYQQHQQDQIDFQQQNNHIYRCASPGIITLRKEVPVSQKPTPVYTSQPAAVSYHGGSNMRGDLKWPPQEYKEAAERENEERRKIAAGPVCRPRRVNRDYTSFFARNALSHHYPSYKVPPGTQHIYG